MVDGGEGPVTNPDWLNGLLAGGIPDASFALMEADARAFPQGSAEGIVQGADPLRQGDDVDVVKEGEHCLTVSEMSCCARA